MTDRSDVELIRLANDGRPEAFNEIVRRYQDKVFNAVYRHVGNYNDAHDIVQHVFLNAFRKLSEFKSESNLGTWLYRIAFNQSVTFFRERGRRKAVSTAFAPASGDAGRFEPAVEGGDPSSESERREIQQKVQEALQTLPEEARQIVILREFEGCAYDEIARVLNIPIGTVRSKLHRARLALKDALKGPELRPPAGRPTRGDDA